MVKMDSKYLLTMVFAFLVILIGCKDDDGDPSPHISMEEYLVQNSDKYEGYIETNSGLIYWIEEEGTGDFPETGDLVKVHYTGYHMDDSQFDSSYGNGFPFSLTLGQNQVIMGWEEGILLMKKGAKCTFFIPSDLAYGKDGAGSIASNEDLRFDIKLIDIVRN